MDNATGYPVNDWLNHLNKSVIEGYMTKRRRDLTASRKVSQYDELMHGSIEIGKSKKFSE